MQELLRALKGTKLVRKSTINGEEVQHWLLPNGDTIELVKRVSITVDITTKEGGEEG